MLVRQSSLGRNRAIFVGHHRTPGRLVTRALASETLSPTVSFKGDDNFKFAPIVTGCWQLAGGHGREVFERLGEKLEAHASAGLTTFDTADIYGQSEEILGQFHQAWRGSGRPPLQLFTKYVPNIYNSRPTPATVEAAVRKSMAALQVSQLDLVQLHWWEYSVPGMVDTAKALADLQAKGLIRHIGTTNINTQALSEIVDAGVPVVSNQVQFSLLDRRPLNGLVNYCQQRNIKVLAYGPVAGGLLSDKFVEEPKQGLFGKPKYTPVDLNTSSLKMYWNVVSRYFGGQELWRELVRALKGVADKHKVSVAAVALRWIMQQGDGKTVYPIVGMRGMAHIDDNAQALSLRLDAADLSSIDAILARATGPSGDVYSFERGL